MCPARGNAIFVISALTTHQSWRSEHELGDAGAMRLGNSQGHAAMQGDDLGDHVGESRGGV